MNEYKNQQFNSYELKKIKIINALTKANGGNLPTGCNNDLFISAVITIMEYLDANYNIKIPAKEIPDNDTFPLKRDEYSMSFFVLNRIAKNVKEFGFSYDISPENNALGYYSPSNHKIVINLNLIRKNTQKIIDSGTYKKYFSSEYKFKTDCTQAVIVHELLHSISDNGSKHGFEIKTKNGKLIQLNEGMTENLAMEIMGMKNFHYTIYKNSGKDSYVIGKNTCSGYGLGCGILDLVRMASKEDMVIPYLVDSSKLKFSYNEELDSSDKPPLTVIAELLEEANKESIKGNYAPYQQLQDMLLENIFTFKYGKGFLDNIRRTGKAPSKEDYDKFKQDMILIGGNIAPTLQQELSLDQKKEFANSKYYTSSKGIVSLIQNNVIKPTSNIIKYKDLLYAMENIQKDFPNDLSR